MLDLAVEVQEADKSSKGSPGDDKPEEIKTEPELEKIKNELDIVIGPSLQAEKRNTGVIYYMN